LLRKAAQVGAGILMAGCTPAGQSASSAPSLTLPPPSVRTSPLPSGTPPPALTATPVADTPTAEPIQKATVAIGQAASYEPQILRAALAAMLANLGGLANLVRPGARVGLKVNLTGGTWWDTPDQAPATERFVTHPALVGALASLLSEAGAKEILVMDGLGDETSFAKWGYTAMAQALGLRLVDLNRADPAPGFFRLPVGSNPLVYDFFFVNEAVRDLDLFVSIAKMKCHTTTGVTLSLKNLFGLVPTSEYRNKAEENNRSAFHQSTRYDTRVAQVILDLNRARPVDLALIDGIATVEAGAGPWDKDIAQVKPGLLVAGLDPVAADSVATALMGFDPTAESGSLPFIGGTNHLDLAQKLGLGTNRMDEIQIAGPSVESVRYPFKPARTT
jgi:uncharacterized protein (DUF362 family)